LASTIHGRQPVDRFAYDKQKIRNLKCSKDADDDDDDDDDANDMMMLYNGLQQ
jgi:hypothetical protein